MGRILKEKRGLELMGENQQHSLHEAVLTVMSLRDEAAENVADCQVLHIRQSRGRLRRSAMLVPTEVSDC